MAELEQKAKEYSQHLYHSKEWNPCEDMLVKAYLTGAKESQLTTGMVIQEDVLRLRIENEQLKAKLKYTERKIKEISQSCYEVENIESIISDLDNLSMELVEC